MGGYVRRNALIVSVVILLLIVKSIGGSRSSETHWGFFAHRLINKLAVFTLPPELLSFYKPYIGYIENHSADPDKRRYVVEGEGIRHYMDLDSWEGVPIESLPATLSEAVFRSGEIVGIHPRGDTLFQFRLNTQHRDSVSNFLHAAGFDAYAYLSEGQWTFSEEQIEELFTLSEECLDCQFTMTDPFFSHGILPYHLLKTYRQLVSAFRFGDGKRVIQVSTELGHYLADAHVPLHTTKNYNGQLSGQTGIHAFWETRIPELFAEDEYDFFVGPAHLIDDVNDYFWSVIRESHSLVSRVLEEEKKVRERIREDRQYCFEDRNGRIVRLPCRSYAWKYQSAMKGMVEKRMRASIAAIGSIWYTAWAEAGSPDMSSEHDVIKVVSPDTIGHSTSGSHSKRK